MPTRDGDFGRERFCNVCGDWWPDTPDFFMQRKGGVRYSPCKACISEARAKTNAVQPCCVPGCNQPRAYWRYSRCLTHKRELNRQHDAARKLRKGGAK